MKIEVCEECAEKRLIGGGDADVFYCHHNETLIMRNHKLGYLTGFTGVPLPAMLAKMRAMFPHMSDVLDAAREGKVH